MQTPGAPLDDEDALLEELLEDEALVELLEDEELLEPLEEELDDEEEPPAPDPVVVLEVCPPLPSGSGALCAHPAVIAKGTMMKRALRAFKQGKFIARHHVRGPLVRQPR